MEYRKIEIGSYNLHLIKTDKFKTIFFKFVFRDEIKKEEITIRNLLFNILVTSSKKYLSQRILNIKKEDLYDLNLYCSNRRIGYHVASELYLSILNPRYTENKMLDSSIDFMKEIIFNPNIKDNTFNQEMFEIAKNIVKTDIVSIKDYAGYYSFFRAKQIMGKDYPFAYNMDGYLEDLEKITPTDLANYYKQVMNNSLLDIYIVGDIDFYEMEKTIKEKIVLKTKKKNKCPIVKDYVHFLKKESKFMEDSTFKQSSLIIGMSLKNITDIERKYTLFLYNTILGNQPDSKLFRNVREKKSLAYNINSYYQKNDNIMFIKTGIEACNANIAIKAIKKEMQEMIKGNFSDDDINNAKELIISSLNEFEEYQNSIAEYFFSMDYLKIDKVEKAIRIIKKITKEDIEKVAKKVRIDLIYLLREQNHEED